MTKKYATIHTTRGLQLLQQAELTGTPTNLTHFVIGDGAGNPVALDDVVESRTGLIREVYRAAINRVFPSATDPLLWFAEIVIPVAVGGFTMREVGLLTAEGDLYVYGNMPEAYKPDGAAAEGAFGDSVYRIAFRVSNAGAVTVMLDPSVAVVTWTMLDNYIQSGALLPPGGATGMVLTKQSNADGDADWQSPDDMTINVDSVEEIQTLAALQTVVDLAVVTTDGLSVYIDTDGTGAKRLTYGTGAHQWLKGAAPNEHTQIVLGQDYPEDTTIVLCQNEPAGRAIEPLAKVENLADVPDKPLARENLGVLSKAATLALVPPGTVSYFASTAAPTGYLAMNGALISDAAYPLLAAVLAKRWNKAGDPATQTRLPDGRGVAIRGWDDGRGMDTGRVFGSFQKASMLYGDSQANSTNSVARVGSSRGALGWDTVSASDYAGATSRATGAGEKGNVTDNHIGGARMANIALLPIIKHD